METTREELRPRLIPTTQCSELLREAQTLESLELDNVPTTLKHPLTATEKETGKTTQQKDIPVLNSESEVIPKPQNLSTQDCKSPEPLPETPEGRYPLRE